MSIEIREGPRGGSGRATRLWMCALLLTCTAAPRVVQARQQPATPRDTTFATGITAGEADAEPRRRQLLNAANLNLGFTTVRIGAGLLVDYVGYDQDSLSREQFRLISVGKLRDARILLGGRIRMNRPVTWQTGIMYDVPTKKWLFRQTGVMVAVPEIWSHFFVGRAKEGFSLNKVMVGYDGWSMERLPFTDATVPLLADGIKWLGATPSRHWFWNLGMFTDWLSEGQTFSSYNSQFVARLGWVPLVSDSAGALLHIALNVRAGDVNNDTLQLRSRPEAFPAPYFIDTGKFPAGSAREIGPEIYYRPGRVLIGGEYYWQRIASAALGNPTFHGGEIVIAWLTTGETRTYNTVGNYFRSVSPAKTVIEGGSGAWEAVLKLSYSDLRSAPLEGGIFWRVTPMLNWHMTDNVRLEFGYGVGKLDRFGMRGTTQFYQARMQLEL
jgi:phosphate-selective porin OprO and OprP